jgi:hypothetical protein
MSDLILHNIKSFLYERQAPDIGRLDGTLHMCKGELNINKEIKIYKSIYPTYILMERYRGSKNKIYYKVYVNQDLEGNINLIRKKEDANIHYFIKPIGAIHIFSSVLQRVPDSYFTIIIEGNSIHNYFIKLNNMNYSVIETHLQITLQNILYHFEYVDFENHQRFNRIM